MNKRVIILAVITALIGTGALIHHERSVLSELRSEVDRIYVSYDGRLDISDIGMLKDAAAKIHNRCKKLVFADKEPFEKSAYEIESALRMAEMWKELADKTKERMVDSSDQRYAAGNEINQKYVDGYEQKNKDNAVELKEKLQYLRASM